MRKSVKLVAALAIAFAMMVLTVGTASATPFHQVQFALKSAPGATVSIPALPLPGTHVTISENLVDTITNAPAGNAFIDCTVLAFTPVPQSLLLACQANFFLNGGNLSGHAVFSTLQHNYLALIDPGSGTGAYVGAAGAVQVEDRAPGDETYHFDLLVL